LPPRACKPSGYPHAFAPVTHSYGVQAKIREACRIAFRRYRSRKDPAAFRTPFLCAVRLRLPVFMPFNLDAWHSHHPRIPSLVPVRGHCGLSAAAVKDAGVIRAEPQSPLRMHWRSPRRGTLRQTRLVFALHPSPPKTASPGSGCPAFRQDSRFSPVAAEPSFRKWPPRGRRSIRRKCPPRTAETRGQLPFSAAQSPRRACFVLRRRAGPLRLRLRWGRRWRASVEGLSRVLKIQPTTRPICPNADKTPHPPEQDQPRTLRRHAPSRQSGLFSELRAGKAGRLLRQP